MPYLQSAVGSVFIYTGEGKKKKSKETEIRCRSAGRIEDMERNA